MSSTNINTSATVAQQKRKERLYRINSKAKYQPVNQGFCPYCWRTVQVNDENRCKICNARCQVKRVTYDTTVKRFEKFMQVNEGCIQEWIPTRPEYKELKIPMQIGRKFYWVPIRYFAEFGNINQNDQKTDENNPYMSFFEYIRSVCHTANNPF